MHFLNKFKFCGNLASSKSIGTIFPIAVAHVVSLCHILLVFAIFQNFHYYYVYYGNL